MPMFELKTLKHPMLLVFMLTTARLTWSHRCAFIPGPIIESNGTAVVNVNCVQQHVADRELSASSEDATGLIVYLYNCPNVSRGLFVNVDTNLLTVVLVSEDSQRMLEGTFEGLQNIVELRLEGFRNLRTISKFVFCPLRSLERLVLVGFGANTLSSAELGTALYQLSGTPLRRIVMHEIYSVDTIDKVVNVSALFQMRNVTVEELTFTNNIITGISGQLSQVLPNLTYVCIGTSARYYAAVKVILDAWLFLNNLSEMTVYGVNVPDSVNILPCGGLIPEIDSNIIRIYLELSRHRDVNCFQTHRFPLPPALTRLSMHEIMLTTDWHKEHSPICFEHDNKVTHLDLSDSVLPPNLTLITGLQHLKYLNVRNTGIQQFPNDFLSYFPQLISVSASQLAIGPWLANINSSFFGSCTTLEQIHLGECQLGYIPSSAFLSLPLLETLNLSGNPLRSFHVNLENNTNLRQLNLSGNAISSLSQGLLNTLSTIAQHRLEASDILTVDLLENPLSCLCNVTYFVRQVQDWVRRQEVDVAGFEEYGCLYPNNSRLAMSAVDVDQLVTHCDVISKIQNGSDCPCDNDLLKRLELVSLSLDGYFCRSSDGNVVAMNTRQLPRCPDLFRSATFIVPVVIGSVFALFLCIASVVIYRYRKNERVSQVIERLSMSRIVRLGIQHVMLKNRDDPNSFNYDLFLYIQEDDQLAAAPLFDTEILPYRQVIGQDDFQVGLKLDALLENVVRCRWLMPVLSQNFVDDGECRDFIARAQYSRPHAIVPVVWSPFHTDDLTINSLLDTAEPIIWPGDHAPQADKSVFWETLLFRTKSEDVIWE